MTFTAKSIGWNQLKEEEKQTLPDKNATNCYYILMCRFELHNVAKITVAKH